MATYELAFLDSARKEWNRLDSAVRGRFIKKLVERLDCPRLPAAALRNLPDCYKIKLRDIGYRLIYRVEDDLVIVTVIAVGRRDKNQVYLASGRRV